MARKERQWSVVNPRHRQGRLSVRYNGSQLHFTTAANSWFEGKERVDLLRSEDGAYAVRRGDASKVAHNSNHVVIARSNLSLPNNTTLTVYIEGDLLVIDPNGDA